jgi:hypothetical protein
MPDYYNSAFHASAGSVHHIEESCPHGSAVPAGDRVPGTGGLPMCDWCREESARRRAPTGTYYNGFRQ